MKSKSLRRDATTTGAHSAGHIVFFATLPCFSFRRIVGSQIALAWLLGNRDYGALIAAERLQQLPRFLWSHFGFLRSLVTHLGLFLFAVLLLAVLLFTSLLLLLAFLGFLRIFGVESRFLRITAELLSNAGSLCP